MGTLLIRRYGGGICIQVQAINLLNVQQTVISNR